MKYQVKATTDLGFGTETLNHYEGESLQAAMEDYQMDMRQVSRGRLDRVEIVADGAVIRFMDKGGQDTEVAVEIEQVSFESLPNRAGHVERFLGQPETPAQAYIVLYQLPNGGWWNGRECQSKQEALDTIAQWKKLNANKLYKIVLAKKS